ncbi:hypothetical protein ACP4OV_010345 [Aristida adscensionis]
MAFQILDKLEPPSFPRFSTILILVCSLLSSCHAKSCKCSSSDDQDSRRIYSRSTTFDRMYLGNLFLADSGTLLPGTLGSYMKNSSSAFKLYDPGWFMIDESDLLWANLFHEVEASFNVSFTASIYSPNQTIANSSRLVFAIIPYFLTTANKSMDLQQYKSWGQTYKGSAQFASIQMGRYNQTVEDKNVTIICVDIQISRPFPGTDYSVSIEYDRIEHRLSVYANDAARKPESPYAISTNMPINMSQFMLGQFMSANRSLIRLGQFGLFSSMGQLLQLQTWNFASDDTLRVTPDNGSQKKGAIILSLVLGSVAATIVMAASVYCYFNSKYRRWKKDLDQLARSMQLLPGVPTQVDFGDIKKATNNFHETSKLGQGGYGAVYRCRLPARIKGEVLEFAVKKFTGNHDRRYGDFLDEVSIINRLRHKNIVPLIGWSYNKGVPLLIYEYMPNGSLDEHLFRSSSDHLQQGTPICQWKTRYNIVKDVATGLHYVHHEYEPMVLHRDIKASNIMIDSTFQGRLGDFGLACTVKTGKESYTNKGDLFGTPGFIAFEYVHSGKATRKTDIFAFGVLILEIVTGKPAVLKIVRDKSGHITDWVWDLHREGKLLDAVDPVLTADEQFDSGDAERLLLLGLACSSPNPSERPSMVEALQVITKSTVPPDVPHERPRFVWPPEENNGLSTSDFDASSASMVQMAATGHAHTQNVGSYLHHRPIGGPSQEHFTA